MTELSSEGQQLLSRYTKRGWFDAAGDERLRDDTSSSQLPRPAYLVIASNMVVPPLSEVQITTRCAYRPFRGRCLVVSDAARRFDLLDLKVRYRSQFRRGEVLSLHTCVGEATPELIRWPLEVCEAHAEICVRAVIPEGAAEDELGAWFEMILLGEVI
jgi:hypothetical protein